MTRQTNSGKDAAKSLLEQKTLQKYGNPKHSSQIRGPKFNLKSLPIIFLAYVSISTNDRPLLV